VVTLFMWVARLPLYASIGNTYGSLHRQSDILELVHTCIVSFLASYSWINRIDDFVPSFFTLFPPIEFNKATILFIVAVPWPNSMKMCISSWFFTFLYK
jgi:hypothetical protein